MEVYPRARSARGKLTNPIFFARLQTEVKTNGNKSNDSAVQEDPEIQVESRSTLFPLRQKARLYERFRYVPHLFPRICQRRHDSRYQEVILVIIKIMVTDPIGDLIVRIKNANAVGKASVVVTSSKFMENIAHALKKSGYISSVGKGKGHRELELGLVYFDGEPRVHDASRISKPSRRVYQKAGDIRTYRSGYGNFFLSTPKGVMSDVDAKKHKVGGEVLFKIW